MTNKDLAGWNKLQQVADYAYKEIGAAWEESRAYQIPHSGQGIQNFTLFLKSIASAFEKRGHKYPARELPLELARDLWSSSAVMIDYKTAIRSLVTQAIIDHFRAQHLGGTQESFNDRLALMSPADAAKLYWKVHHKAVRSATPILLDISWRYILPDETFYNEANTGGPMQLSPPIKAINST